MYGYSEYTDISPNEILGKVSQEDIFEYILQQPFSYGDRYISPIRVDTSPGCKFTEREDGVVLFTDFGNEVGKTHLTCWGLIMEINKVNLQGAINIVIEAFGLPRDKKEYTEPMIFNYNGTKGSYYKNREDVRESLVKITYKKKLMERRDIIYWSKFLITPQNLWEDAVHSASYIHINNGYKQKSYGFHPMGLCYAIDFIDAVKVYQPLAKEYKWISNCNENHIGNIDNLPKNGDRLVICKSYKDHRVMRNLTGEQGYVWFQAEGTVPSTDILVNLTQRFKEIVVFYDNDDKGIESSRKLAQFLCEIKENIARAVWIPIEVGYKDVAEMVSKEGRKDTLELVKQLI